VPDGSGDQLIEPIGNSFVSQEITFPNNHSCITIHNSTARHPNPARWYGAVPPLVWRVLIERTAGL